MRVKFQTDEDHRRYFWLRRRFVNRRQWFANGGGIRCRLKLREKRSFGIGDLPAAFVALNEMLSEYVQLRRAGGEPFHSRGPIRPAGDENRNIALQIGQAGPTLRMSLKDF